MQKTAPPPIDLEALEQLSQQQLQEQLPQMAPLQVRCYLREETLVMLVEHHPPVLAYPHQAFRIFEQVVREANIPRDNTGLIYLRMQGQPQPYAFHIAKRSPERSELAPLSPESTPVLPEEVDASSELIEAEREDGALVESPELESTPQDPLKPDWMPVIVAGTGLSALVFFISLYVLSRPCVLGGCEAIPTAQKLAQESTVALQEPTSGKEILQAQVQLNRSIRVLRSIPVWSKRHSEANKLLNTYERTAEDLNALVDALKIGARAGNLTQNPPLRAEKWEEAQKVWQQAIALLEGISESNEFYGFARDKYKEYRRNLRVVERALTAEQDAQENLAAAKETAKTAEVRQELAQSLEDLRLVEGIWQRVSSRLWQIPRTTTVYPDAQEALNLYLPKIATLRDRKNQEVFAVNTYNRAVRFSKSAQEAEKASQWSDAVANWRNALSFIQQVPENAFDYGKAQTLTKTYTNRLSQAEVKLQSAVKIQQARNDLEQLCTKTTKVCHFTISEKGIKIQLTPTYVRDVRQTAMQAQNQGDLKMQVELLDHVYILERALNTISNNVGLPLEVYTSDNVLVQSHVPGQN